MIRRLEPNPFAAGWRLKVFMFPATSNWYSAFRSELLSFPAGKYDDQVDALGLVGQLLDQMVPGQKPKEPPKPKHDTGYRPIGFDERPLDWLVF